VGEREKNRRAVERLAVRRLEHLTKAGVRTTYEREHAEAAKVARDTDATDSDRRRGMASNIRAKQQREDARAEARERGSKDTSSRPGESKQAWLERMRAEHKKG